MEQDAYEPSPSKSASAFRFSFSNEFWTFKEVAQTWITFEMDCEQDFRIGLNVNLNQKVGDVYEMDGYEIDLYNGQLRIRRLTVII